MTENQIATIIVDAAYTVHSKLGPGLLESVYEASLARELAKRGMKIRRQQAMPVVYAKISQNRQSRQAEPYYSDLLVWVALNYRTGSGRDLVV